MNRKNNKQYSSIPVFARTIGFQTFPVSRIRAFISFLFLLILLTPIAGITAIVFIIYGILPDWAAIAVSLFIFLLGIIYSEGIWFGLTCSRFATLTNNRLVLYGAFGRERFSCPTDWTFEYRKKFMRGPFYLHAISPEGRVHVLVKGPKVVSAAAERSGVSVAVYRAFSGCWIRRGRIGGGVFFISRCAGICTMVCALRRLGRCLRR